jgi:hypothetical protein
MGGNFCFCSRAHGVVLVQQSASSLSLVFAQDLEDSWECWRVDGGWTGTFVLG